MVFSAHIMIKFKKVLNLNLVLSLLAAIFLSYSTAYSADLSLRVPLLSGGEEKSENRLQATLSSNASLRVINVFAKRGIIETEGKGIAELENEVINILVPSPLKIADKEIIDQLIPESYIPGTVRHGDIKDQAYWLNYRNFLIDKIVRFELEQLAMLEASKDLIDPSEKDIERYAAGFVSSHLKEVISTVTAVLDWKPAVLGHQLREELTNNELNNMVRIVMKTVLLQDPYSRAFYPQELNNDLANRIAVDILAQAGKMSLPERLKMSIGSGVMDITNPGLQSEFMADKEGFIKKYFKDSRNQDLVIDFWSKFKNEVINAETPITLGYLLDNNGEAVFDLAFIQDMLKINPNITIVLISKQDQAGNDASYNDVSNILKNEVFSDLRDYMGTKRFVLLENGPHLQGIDLRKVSPELGEALLSCDIILAKGQANYEMTNGIKKVIYPAFIVKGETTQTITGISKERKAFVFARIGAGDKSFLNYAAKEKMSVVDPVDGRRFGVSEKTLLDYLESKDYLTEKLFWGSISKRQPVFTIGKFRLMIERFMGIENIVYEQRVPLEQRNKAEIRARKALKEIARKTLAYLEDSGRRWDTLTQEEFNHLFGVSQIVTAAGLSSRYNGLIHKTISSAGQGEPNIRLAINGSYKTSQTTPTIVIGEDILLMIVKDEILCDPKRLEQLKDALQKDPLLSDDYLDMEKKTDLLTKNAVLIYMGPTGYGNALMEAMERLKDLGTLEDTAYKLIVFGEMAAATLQDLSNASFITYLEALSNPYLVTVGARESEGEGLKAIAGKGNFTLEDGRLVALTEYISDDRKRALSGLTFLDWEQTPVSMKESLKNKFALSDNGRLLINANAGVFRNDVIDFFDSFRENKDFIHYDSRSKTETRIAWDLIRSITAAWEKEHTDRPWPAGLVDVGKAPSSIKDIPRQVKFTKNYLEQLMFELMSIGVEIQDLENFTTDLGENAEFTISDLKRLFKGDPGSVSLAGKVHLDNAVTVDGMARIEDSSVFGATDIGDQVQIRNSWIESGVTGLKNVSIKDAVIPSGRHVEASISGLMQQEQDLLHRLTKSPKLAGATEIIDQALKNPGDKARYTSVAAVLLELLKDGREKESLVIDILTDIGKAPGDYRKVLYKMLALSGIFNIRDEVFEIAAKIDDRQPGYLKTINKQAIALSFDSTVVPVLIVAGPSGTGKSTFIEELLKVSPGNFAMPRLTTTRNPRMGTTPDSHKIFVDEDTFFKEEAEGNLSMVRSRHGHRYGLHKNELIKYSDKTLVFDTTSVESIQLIKNVFPHSKVIVVLPDTLENLQRLSDSEIYILLKERINNRSDIDKAELNERLKGALDFIKDLLKDKVLADTIIVNDSEDNLEKNYTLFVEVATAKEPPETATRLIKKAVDQLLSKGYLQKSI